MASVFLNGEIVEESAARVAAGDRGLLLGDGLFESMRAYRGKVFRPGRARAAAAGVGGVPAADRALPRTTRSRKPSRN